MSLPEVLHSWTTKQWRERKERDSVLAIVHMTDGSILYRMWCGINGKFQCFPDSHHISMRHQLPHPGMPYPKDILNQVVFNSQPPLLTERVT